MSQNLRFTKAHCRKYSIDNELVWEGLWESEEENEMDSGDFEYRRSSRAGKSALPRRHGAAKRSGNQAIDAANVVKLSPKSKPKAIKSVRRRSGIRLGAPKRTNNLAVDGTARGEMEPTAEPQIPAAGDNLAVVDVNKIIAAADDTAEADEDCLAAVGGTNDIVPEVEPPQQVPPVEVEDNFAMMVDDGNESIAAVNDIAVPGEGNLVAVGGANANDFAQEEIAPEAEPPQQMPPVEGNSTCDLPSIKLPRRDSSPIPNDVKRRRLSSSVRAIGFVNAAAEDAADTYLGGAGPSVQQRSGFASDPAEVVDLSVNSSDLDSNCSYSTVSFYWREMKACL